MTHLCHSKNGCPVHLVGCKSIPYLCSTANTDRAEKADFHIPPSITSSWNLLLPVWYGRNKLNEYPSPIWILHEPKLPGEELKIEKSISPGSIPTSSVG
jgi:hypothetical protein